MDAVALTRQQMLAGMYARDGSFNGTYLVGVTSTSIYCLPDCPARKPKADNVLFFLQEADARNAGFRPCKRCRPDQFYAGVDSNGEVVMALAEQIHSAPQQFGGAHDIVRRAGFGATKLNELFLHHFHETPRQMLLRARVERAAELLAAGRQSPADIAFAVGFGSLGSFYQHFKAHQRLTPADYRALGRSDTFLLELPTGYQDTGPRALLGRDPDSPAEAARGAQMSKALWLDRTAARLDFRFGGRQVHCTVVAHRTPSPAALREAHRRALKLLGLHWDPQRFLTAARRVPEITALTAPMPYLRPASFGDGFEALCWAVVGQQVTVQFAATLRRRIIQHAGTPVPGNMRAHPLPAQLADMDPGALTAMQISRAKARTLAESAAHIAAGELDLDASGVESIPALRQHLGQLWGIGPWTTEYLLLRGLGFADVAPVGDSGLRQALKRFFGLESAPNDATASQLMSRFAPHRSLATHHLWRHWTR